jgi:hypothetical protein
LELSCDHSDNKSVQAEGKALHNKWVPRKSRCRSADVGWGQAWTLDAYIPVFFCAPELASLKATSYIEMFPGQFGSDQDYLCSGSPTCHLTLLPPLFGKLRLLLPAIAAASECLPQCAFRIEVITNVYICVGLRTTVSRRAGRLNPYININAVLTPVLPSGRDLTRSDNSLTGMCIA